MTIRLILIAFLMTAAPAQAGPLDANDPSAVGTDDGIRVEARLVRDTITSGVTIGVTYEVENLTPEPIAIATKLCSASYDPDARTVVVSVGSEIPDATSAARLAIIPSGAKKTFSAGAAPHFALMSTPRFVQIKINVLRGWSAQPVATSDKLYDEWLERNATILLNALPVHYVRSESATGAETR